MRGGEGRGAAGRGPDRTNSCRARVNPNPNPNYTITSCTRRGYRITCCEYGLPFSYSNMQEVDCARNSRRNFTVVRTSGFLFTNRISTYTNTTVLGGPTFCAWVCGNASAVVNSGARGRSWSLGWRRPTGTKTTGLSFPKQRLTPRSRRGEKVVAVVALTIIAAM